VRLINSFVIKSAFSLQLSADRLPAMLRSSSVMCDCEKDETKISIEKKKGNLFLFFMRVNNQTNTIGSCFFLHLSYINGFQLFLFYFILLGLPCAFWDIWIYINVYIYIFVIYIYSVYSVYIFSIYM